MPTLEILEDIGRYCAEAERLAAGGRGCIAHSAPWLLSWWETVPPEDGGRQPHLLLVRERGVTRASFPLVRSRGFYHGIGIRKLSFAMDELAPGMEFLLSPEDADGTLAAFLDHVAGREAAWDVVVLDRVTDGPDLDRLLEAVRKRGDRCHVETVRRSPVVPIRGTWKEYWGSRAPNFRKSQRSLVNQAEKKHACTVEAVSGDGMSARHFSMMEEISRKSWKGRTGTALGDLRGHTAFYRRLQERMPGYGGSVRLWILRVKGDPAAYVLQAVLGRTVYALRTDYDEAHAGLSPGSVLQYHILADAFDSGRYDLYDFCAAEYRYLRAWADEFRTSRRVLLFNRRLWSQAMYVLEGGVRERVRRSPLAMQAKDFIFRRMMPENVRKGI